MLKNLESLLASSQTFLPFEDHELTELPVFPLPRVVMFPCTIVPFHLFEPRYTAMIEHCLAQGPQAIAVAHMDDERNETMAKVASVGRILAHRINPDGTYDIALAFVSRVFLHESKSKYPFRICRAEVLRDQAEDAQEQERAFLEVQEILEQVRLRLGIASWAGETELFASTDALHCASSFRWADMLVGDAAERQKILSDRSATRRLRHLRGAALSVLAEIALKGPLN